MWCVLTDTVFDHLRLPKKYQWGSAFSKGKP